MTVTAELLWYPSDETYFLSLCMPAYNYIGIRWVHLRMKIDKYNMWHYFIIYILSYVMLHFFQKKQGVITFIMDKVIYVLILFTAMCGSYRKPPEPFRGNLARPLGVRRSTTDYMEPYYLRTYPKLFAGHIISHLLSKIMI